MSDTHPAQDPTIETREPAPAAQVGPTPSAVPAEQSAGRPSDVWVGAARSALTRYRAMAWVTGCMLLVLCLEMLLKYVFQAAGLDDEGHANSVLGSWVAFAHGWIYVVYLGVVFDLWSKMRWPLSRLAAMAAAGVVPVMSFVLERRVHAGVLERIDAGRTSRR